MPLVFISHSSKDDLIVNQIAERLRAAGIDIWVDHQKGITPGDPFDDRIQAAIQACSAMLFAASPDSIASEECLAEWRYLLALKRRGDPKNLYTAVIKPIDLDNFPYRLLIYQYVNLEKDFDGSMSALIESISGGREALPDSLPAVLRDEPITGFDQMPNADELRLIPMHGRANDLQTVLKDLNTRIITLTGVGGLGKSKLALETIRSAPGFKWAVWQYAGTAPRIDALFDLLADSFGLEKPVRTDDVLRHPRLRETLIVLDNGESITDAGQRAQFADWLKRFHGHGAKVLITSRFEWDELPNARNISPGALSAESAAQIAREMIAFHHDDETLMAHAEAIAEAARRHPRLIEFAVGLMKRRPYSVVMADLASLKTSTKGQQALDEMFVKTVEQMSAEAGDQPRWALKRLNVCRGSFTLYAAAAILDLKADQERLLELLEILQKWQFVRFDRESERYRIDPLVIEAVGEDDSAHTAHYDFYYALAQFHDEKQSYYLLEPDSANLETAFEWAMVTDAEWALNLLNEMGLYLLNRGRIRQFVEWAERVSKALENHIDQGLRANAQNSLGVAYTDLAVIEDAADNVKRAITAFARTLEYYIPSAEPMKYAATQNNLGVAYGNLAGIEDAADNLKRAITAFERALDYYTPSAAPMDYAMTQSNLGNAYGDLAGIEDQADNLKRAISCDEQALKYWTPSAAPMNYAGTQNNLGIAYRNLAEIEDQAENLKRAVTAYAQALEYRTPSAAPLDYAMTQQNLGIALEDSGDLAGAVACWREAETYFRKMGYTGKADRMRARIEKGEARLGG